MQNLRRISTHFPGSRLFSAGDMVSQILNFGLPRRHIQIVGNDLGGNRKLPDTAESIEIIPETADMRIQQPSISQKFISSRSNESAGNRFTQRDVASKCL